MKRIYFLLLILSVTLISCSQKSPLTDSLNGFKIYPDTMSEDSEIVGCNSIKNANSFLSKVGEIREYKDNNVTILYPFYFNEFRDNIVMSGIQNHILQKVYDLDTNYDFFISEGQSAYSVVFYDSTSASSSKNNLFSITFSKEKDVSFELTDFISRDDPFEHIRSTVSLLYGVDPSLDEKVLPTYYVSDTGIVIVDKLGNRFDIPSDYFDQKPYRRVFVGNDYAPVIDPNEKVVALTFDDGPHWTVTPQVLDTLKEKGIKASFFVIGCNISGNEHLLRRMADQGCDVGIHSYYHKNYNTMTYDSIMKDIEDCSDLIFDATYRKPHLVRPPYGNMPLSVIEAKDYFYINWCVDPYDWNSSSSDQIVDHVLNHVRPGSIVLMHDIYKTSAEALPRIIDELSADGWRFVTITELFDLKDKEPSGKTYYGLGY